MNKRLIPVGSRGRTRELINFPLDIAKARLEPCSTDFIDDNPPPINNFNCDLECLDIVDEYLPQPNVRLDYDDCRLGLSSTQTATKLKKNGP
jgi:hypothetical protein